MSLPLLHLVSDQTMRTEMEYSAQPYGDAVKNGDMVVFIRDNAGQRLLSYSVPLSDFNKTDVQGFGGIAVRKDRALTALRSTSYSEPAAMRHAP